MTRALQPFALAAAAALLSAAPAIGAGQDLPPRTFRSGVQAVRVDVLVTDRGRPVPGLTAADFDLLDNGAVQAVSLLEFNALPLDVTLAFDMSRSVTASRLTQLQTAAGHLLDGLAARDTAGLITFSHAVTRAQPLTPDVERVRDALSRVHPSGGTALVDAAYAGMIAGESGSGRALLILFSDGVDTGSWLTPEAVVDTAARTDVVVYSVVRGRQAPSFLRELSETTGGQIFENQTAADLEKRFLAVLEEFRQRYLLVYTPAGVSAGGWHRIEVRVKGRRVKVTARSGYTAGSS